MSRRIHVLALPLIFPAGLAAGESGSDNRLTIARDGLGRPLLRGTSLAGRLRQVWRRRMLRMHDASAVDAAVTRFFGSAAGDDEDAEARETIGSPLRVGDVSLNISLDAKNSSTVVERTHHLRDRHPGVVADGGLFSLEACPPGTTGLATLWLHDDDDSPDESAGFLGTIVELFAGGATLGGKSARGIGLAKLSGQVGHRVYDLRQAESHAQYLDDHRTWRSKPEAFAIRESWRPATASARQETGEAAPASSLASDRLCVTLTLGIPRGQDLLVADGQGLLCDAEPQRVVDAMGRQLWRLPGSSLRGLFRGWFNRLAAFDDAARNTRGETPRVADNVERRTRVARGLARTEDTLNGDNLGWTFLPKSQRNAKQARTDCPVARLFGALFQAGRIHVSDAYAPCSSTAPNANAMLPEEQFRKHVAVDAVSGGAVENLLFENTTLVGKTQTAGLRFEVTIQMELPSQEEVQWLVKTIRALDVGVLRVGSSKSSGRLSLVKAPAATGSHAELVRDLKPYFSSKHFYS